jgi:hypothetical protein
MSNVEVLDASPRPPASSVSSLLRPLDLGEFLKLKLPPRRLMLAPWLSEKGTAMIYSPRGVGKTLLGLSAGQVWLDGPVGVILASYKRVSAGHVVLSGRGRGAVAALLRLRDRRL